MKFLIMLLFFTTLSEAAWDIHDVTTILPLPSRGQESLYLHPNTALAENDVALPLQTYLRTVRWIAPLVPQTHATEHYESLTALAFRIDPCFRDSFGDSCRRQLRIIWQPVIKGVALDAGVHTFYEFTESEFTSLIAELASIKQNFSERRFLGVHPVILQEGMSGPFARSFLQIISKYARFSRMKRLTALILNPPGNNWSFQGYEIRGSSVAQMKIPGFPKIVQTFENDGPADEFLSRTLFQTPITLPDQLLALFQDSRVREDADFVQNIYRSSLRLQNPGRHLPGTVDCLSCHMAQSALIWSSQKLSEADKGRFKGEAYPSPLLNPSKNPGDTGVFRMLGYFNQALIVNDRVGNESLEVVRAVNSR